MMCERRADFLDPSKWKLAAYGGFFREENIRWDASRSFFDNLALVLALWQRTLRTSLRCFQSCVVSLRLVSGQVLSDRSDGFRQS